MSETTSALTLANRRIRDLDKLVQSLTIDIEDLEGQLQRARERCARHRLTVRAIAIQYRISPELEADLALIDALFDAAAAEEDQRRANCTDRASTKDLSPLAQIARCAPSSALTWLLDQLGDTEEAEAA